MLNKVFIMGRLTRDPELRRTQAGTAVASFTLAVDRDYKDKSSGERGVDWVNCVAWRQSAEFVSRYFTKGRMAVVEGRLQVSEWTDQEGSRHWKTEVVADNIYFGDSKAALPKSSPAGDASSPARGEPRSGYTEEQDVDDGELPF